MVIPRRYFRFTKLELREVRIPFRFSFKHALAKREEAHNLLIALHTDTGHVGYGEIIPRSYLTGETIESAWKDVSQRWWPELQRLRFPLDRAPFGVLRDLYLEADRQRKTASYAGLDVAVIDGWARAVGCPGQRLFIRNMMPLPLSAPLGEGRLETIRRLALLFRLLGFREFKLKVGGVDDERKVAAVRAVIGPCRDLRVDANAAWTVEEAIEWAHFFRRLKISSMEQPIPSGDVSALARVQRKGGLPVVADESLCCLADAEALAEEQAVSCWNVRLAKVGGFSGVREMIGLAQKHGISLHMGVLVGETSVLSAACRACFGLGCFRHVEYGFPAVLLRSDPFRYGPGGYFGIGYPIGDRSGLGVEPIDKRLAQVTVRQESFYQKS